MDKIITCPYCHVHLSVKVGEEMGFCLCPNCGIEFVISKFILERPLAEQLLPKYPLEITMAFSKLPTVEISKRINMLHEKLMIKENKKRSFEPELK